MLARKFTSNKFIRIKHKWRVMAIITLARKTERYTRNTFKRDEGIKTKNKITLQLVLKTTTLASCL